MASDGHRRIVDRLLASPEPAIRWKARARVLGETPPARLRDEVRDCDLVRRMLAPLAGPDRPPAYAKWQGAHWVLAALADLGYPPGDPALCPLRDQVLDTWLHPSFYTEFEATAKSSVYRRAGVPVMRGRHRRCASQQGNALWFLITLGLADERRDALVERLLHWQWPDGGWNCDKNPDAHTSSFCETLLPMRGLAAYGKAAGGAAWDAALRAAEVLLSRRLLYRASTGALIRPEFTKLHSPLYWHYDYLGGLKALADLDLLHDPRCADALDRLEAARLPDGWPAQARYYKVSSDIALHHDCVDWGGTSARRANPWVTVDALAVLRAAGRLRL